MAFVAQPSIFLSEIVRRKVICRDKRIGSLADMIIVERGPIPEVTHVVVNRPFGHPALFVPWERVILISSGEIVIDIEDPTCYEREPFPGCILLRDYVLDKKVLDLDGNEVEVVYDVKLAVKEGRLFASEVDFSKKGLLRRLHLKGLANWLSTSADKEEGILSWAYIQPLPEKIGSFSGDVRLRMLKDRLADIHPVDLADMLEELDHKQRLAIFNELETGQASDTLEEVEPRIQRDLIASTGKERVAELIDKMTPAQAADVLHILPASEAEEILKRINIEQANKIRGLIEKHEQNILLLMTSKYLKLPPTALVDEVIEGYRQMVAGMDVIMYIYVVDATSRLLGVVSLGELLQASTGQSLENIMNTEVVTLGPDSSLLEASKLFSRYSFRAIPVVDEHGAMLGVIPYRDVMEIEHRFL